MELINKAKNILSDAKIYWKTPMKGKYINYRSIFSYSVGGIGVYSIITMYNTISVSATNAIISNQTGIGPTQLTLMYTLTFFISIFFTGFRAKMIDNARSKKGKYRPYILTMGIPTALLCGAIVFVPYDKLPELLSGVFGLAGEPLQTASKAVSWVIAFLLNLGLQFTYGFFYEAYDSLIYVMSPNSQERTDVVAIKSVVYSFAPTVLTPLTYWIQGWIGVDDIYDIRVYKVMFPPVLIFGVLLSALVYRYTEEKIVQAKTHVVDIHFIDALRAVMKNKYFWIISLAGWIGFLESFYNYILTWLYNYAHWCDSGAMGVINIIYGNASLWGMIAAPFAIKKWGKKKVLIVTNAFNILFIALLYPAIGIGRSIWLVLACLYMNALAGSFAHILNPSLTADIRDYQQYISGERIDGMFAAVGLIGSFISLLTGFVQPAIFESYGIFDGNGYENMYDILNDPNVLFPLMYLLIMLAVIGAVMNVIPYFFYDLSELKQQGMVRVLKIRALFEDHGNHVLKDADLIEAVDIIRSARLNAEKAPVSIEKSSVQAAKANGKAAVKQAKKALKEAKAFNEEIEISRIVVAELNKFSTRRVQLRLERAKTVYAAGISYTQTAHNELFEQANALPRKTKEEREIYKDALQLAKEVRLACRCAAKNFSQGIPAVDLTALSALFDKEDAKDAEIKALYRKISEYKKQKSSRLSDARLQMKILKADKKIIENKIKEQTKLSTLYHRATKPYYDALRLVQQERDYNHFEEIEALYDDAVRREQLRLAKEEAERKALENERKKQKEALAKK